MARLGYGLTQSGCKLKRRVTIGWYFFVHAYDLSAYYDLLSPMFDHICLYIRRLRGAWEMKPADKVDREKSREYLVKYVLPAIKEKWPESDRWNTIYVQQDNAKTHIKPDDPIFFAGGC
jgi:hypothetical protein